MFAALLALLAVGFIAVAPRVLAGATSLRRRPRAGLWLWQTSALAGVLCVVATPLVAVHALTSLPASPANDASRGLSLAALALSAVVLARLLINAHLVGSRLRAARARHRTLVDLVGTHHSKHTRVLPHTMPTAYCVPGLRHRVVLSESALARLSEDELQAVIAHELAHLGERHDLLLEYFAVVHRTAPSWLRSENAVREVALLIERLADEAARHKVGEIPLARAMVSLAGASTPEGALGIRTPGATAIRMEMLTAEEPSRAGTLAAYLLGIGALALPIIIVVAAFVA